MYRSFLTLFLIVGFSSLLHAREPSPLLYKKNPASFQPNTKAPQPRTLVLKLKSRDTIQLSARSLQVQSGILDSLSLKPIWRRPSTPNKTLSHFNRAASIHKTRYFKTELQQALSDPERQSLIEQLRTHPDVESVQWNHYYPLHTIRPAFSPNDSAYASQWNLRIIQAPEAWEITTGDSAVKVGIIDTGIDYTHPDLIPSLYINPQEDLNQNGTFEPWPYSEKRDPVTFELDPGGLSGDFDSLDQDQNGYPDDIIGWDFTSQPLNIDHLNGFSDFQDPDADPFDDNSHGTACAGIVAASANNSIGLAGVAPSCKLVALRVFTAAGYANDIDIASAIVYAADNNIRVLNMSFGDVVLSPLLKDAIQYAHDNGVVMCASSGNAGGDKQHFPSGYDEVISTVATTPFDDVTSFSTFGITVDIGAPGTGITTTMPFYKDYYTNSFGGTSAAAPHTAGVAALLLSQNPDLTPGQVRGILTSTADDIALAGWDHFSGAGRVNANLALQSVGSPIAQILSPAYDAGIGDSLDVVITGTATSPNFQRFQLSYRPGTTFGGEWTPISENSKQRIKDTLGIWQIAPLQDSSYTLRLTVYQANGKTIEARQRVFLDRSKPQLSNFTLIDAYLNDRHGLLLSAETDDLCAVKVHYRPQSSSEPYTILTLPDIRRTHETLLQSENVQPGTQYSFYLTAENRAGLLSTSDTLNGSLDPEIVPTPSVSGYQFKDQTARALPKGYYLGLVEDFNQNGRPEILMNESLPLEGKKYGSLKRFEYNAVEEEFVLLDSVPGPYIPRDLADFNKDGKLDVLVQSGGRTILFSQNSPTSSPFSSMLYADSLTGNVWGARLADTKNNGELELIARNDTAYFILDQNYNQIAILPNPVKLAKDGSRPAFEEPKALVSDFDGDGRPEILVGDYDANFIMYEYSGSANTYNQTWLYLTDYIGGSNWLVSGNFLDNGKTQFLIGYHSNENQNSQNDYDPQVWVFELYQASGDNSYEQLWKKAFYNYKPAFYFSSATAAGDLNKDGRDELFILAYPNLYVFSWSDATQSFQADWMNPRATANGLIIEDIDGNNLKELIFSDDLTAKIYEYQQPTGPAPPIGIRFESLSDTTLQLSWLPVASASGYNIYRETYLSPATRPTTLIAQTAQPEFLDTTVTGKNNQYIYAITSRSGGLESDTGRYFIARPHSKPRLINATFNNGFLRLGFSEPLDILSVNASKITIQKESGPLFSPGSVTLAGGGYSLVASFKPLVLEPGTYTVSLGELWDEDYGRLDTAYKSHSFEVSQSSAASFYISTSRVISANQVVIDFNKAVSVGTALKLDNYLLSPFGRIAKVELQNAQKSILIIIEGTDIGGLGISQTLQLSNLVSQDGTPIDTRNGGNIISFDEVKETLSKAFIYPNPFKLAHSGQNLMFANLTRSGTIDIYSLSGRHLQHIAFNTPNGGVMWDAKTKSGEPLSSGIYIYRIKGPEDEEKIGKFAVIK